MAFSQHDWAASLFCLMRCLWWGSCLYSWPKEVGGRSQMPIFLLLQAGTAQSKQIVLFVWVFLQGRDITSFGSWECWNVSDLSLFSFSLHKWGGAVQVLRARFMCHLPLLPGVPSLYERPDLFKLPSHWPGRQKSGIVEWLLESCTGHHLLASALPSLCSWPGGAETVPCPGRECCSGVPWPCLASKGARGLWEQ